MYMNTMQNNSCGCASNTMQNNNVSMPNNSCGCKNSVMKNNYNDEYMENMCSYVPNYNNMTDECSCGFDDKNSYFPNNPMFGQSYVPMQTMNNTFKPCIGLKMGTIFPELVNPYMPCQSIKKDEYIQSTNEIKEGCNKC